MIKTKVFIAVPISAFSDTNEYHKYREKVLLLVKKLRDNSFEVYSEIEHINDKVNYDSPDQAVLNDFENINNSDIFIFLHPKKIQTSTLIELGYACAKEKFIIVVGTLRELPYLAIGLLKMNNIDVIESNELDSCVIEKIKNVASAYMIGRKNYL